METTKPQENLTKIEITDTLFNFPFNTSLIGYPMLVDAIDCSLKYNSNKLNLSKVIYEEVATKYGVQKCSVEKAIRGALTSVSDAIKDTKNFVYPNTIMKNAIDDGRPKHFISAVCELVRLKLMKSGI